VRRGNLDIENACSTPTQGCPSANAGEIAAEGAGIDKGPCDTTTRNPSRFCPSVPRCHDAHRPLGFALENFGCCGRCGREKGFGYQGRVGDNESLIDA